ncbi:MAG: glycosyltransferase family 2 protein [Candidatus Omnitrophica bacterium]|nr:glycosyltransferase family 2 protein [Candidatus Omnitrophota bacterium]
MSILSSIPSVRAGRDFVAGPSTALCDIIIPVWNNFALTRRCLKSILKHTGVPIQLILIDNASAPPTRDFLLDFKTRTPVPLQLIRNVENLGNIKAVNQGIAASGAPYLLILDNDTRVFPGWLEGMIAAARSSEDIGLVNPQSNSLGSRKPWYRSWDTVARRAALEEKNDVLETATATGFCMLVKRALVERIGGWCEDYGLGYFDDEDYSLRAARAGFRCVQARGAFVYHEEQASFRKMKRARQKLWAHNRALFEGRYGRSGRIAYCLARSTGPLREKVLAEAFTLARANHWIWIFEKRGFTQPDVPAHSNIREVRLLGAFFPWNCLFRIVTKKKQFEKVVTDDAGLISILRRARPLHRAELEYIRP